MGVEEKRQCLSGVAGAQVGGCQKRSLGGGYGRA